MFADIAVAGRFRRRKHKDLNAIVVPQGKVVFMWFCKNIVILSINGKIESFFAGKHFESGGLIGFFAIKRIGKIAVPCSSVPCLFSNSPIEFDRAIEFYSCNFRRGSQQHTCRCGSQKSGKQ